MNRRQFLYGVGGALVALPALEGLRPKGARAASAVPSKFAVIIRQANGVVQKAGSDPERFWLDKTGPLTPAILTAASDRAVSVLADYAPKMNLVRGLNYAFPANGCGHSGGGNQCLTAAKVSTSPSGNKSLAMGESIDNRIAEELTPGVEPLTLYSGRMEGFINEVLSYRGPMQLRAAERNPINAYQRLFGTTTTGATDAAAQKQALMRKSVNDLVRDQMKSLMSRTDLSQDDKQRLDLHFTSIRDLEVGLACGLTAADIQAMNAISPNVADAINREAVARMQCDIIALSFACGATRVATLQMGDGNDGTQYTFSGMVQPRYHQISHRIFSDGTAGDPIPDAVEKHHQIDLLHARLFKYLLDKLSSYKFDGGTLLDYGVAVWTNDLATGPGHGFQNLPYVLVGSAGGFLKTGQYIDAGNVTNNKILNTIGAAVGCKNGAGPLDNFGDPSLKPGLVTAMVA